MNRLLRLLSMTVFWVALPATRADAAPCGGDDDDGSDSDSSSFDSGDDSSESSESAVCTEQSEIVGRSVCSRFGGWDSQERPRMTFGVGVSFHRFAMSNADFSGTATHTREIPYRLVVGEAEPEASAAGATVDLRAIGVAARYLYGGVEVDIGGVAVPATRATTGDGLAVDASSALYIFTGGVAGAQLPIGDVVIRAEAVAGVRSLGLAVETRHLDCVARSTAFEHQLLVQPRIALDTWLSPWLTLGAYVGANAFDRDDISVGLSIVGHLRAFDAAH